KSCEAGPLGQSGAPIYCSVSSDTRFCLVHLIQKSDWVRPRGDSTKKLRISLAVSPLPYDKIAVEVLNLTTSRGFFVCPAGQRAAPARFPRVRHQPASGFREIPRSRIMTPRRYGPLPMSRSTTQRASDGGFIVSEGTSVSLTGSRVAWST